MNLPETTLTTYVVYLLPGLIVSEESVKKVDNRNPQQVAKDAPDGAFAFFYFDIVTSVVDMEGERVETTSDRRNISKTYYIDAELLDYDAVSALPGDHDILLTNMRVNRLANVLCCRTGNFQFCEPDKHELVSTG